MYNSKLLKTHSPWYGELCDSARTTAPTLLLLPTGAGEVHTVLGQITISVERGGL